MKFNYYFQRRSPSSYAWLISHILCSPRSCSRVAAFGPLIPLELHLPVGTLCILIRSTLLVCFPPYPNVAAEVEAPDSVDGWMPRRVSETGVFPLATRVPARARPLFLIPTPQRRNRKVHEIGSTPIASKQDVKACTGSMMTYTLYREASTRSNWRDISMMASTEEAQHLGVFLLPR